MNGGLIRTFVPLSETMLEDFTGRFLPLWIQRELTATLTMREYGETWFRPRGELELLEFGFAEKWDSIVDEDCTC